jgi:membrane protease subunit (stomatin/prohibitin family)
LLRFFRGLYLTTAKDSISTYLTQKEISVLEINAHLSDLSEHIAERMRPTFNEYGIRLVNFFVKSVNIPDDDPAAIKLRDALAKRAEMNIIGFDYTQERSFDTLEGAATNPGSEASSTMGAGLGMGMGVPIGGMVGTQFGGMMQNVNTGQTAQVGQHASMAGVAPVVVASEKMPTKECPGCKAKAKAEQRFCSDCGTDLQQVSVAEELGNCVVLGACVCGFEITSNEMKFCSNCGESLEKKCNECETPYCGEPKFCSECGNELRK